jgi:hypothetical protein
VALRENGTHIMQAWTPETVASLIQIPYRTLMRWLKTGCVEASVAPPRGERKQVLLGLEDVLEVCVVATLRRTGQSMEYVLSLLRQLRADGVALTDVYLITVDDEIVSVYRSAGEASKLFDEPGQKIILPVAHWRALAQGALHEEGQVIVA